MRQTILTLSALIPISGSIFANSELFTDSEILPKWVFSLLGFAVFLATLSCMTYSGIFKKKDLTLALIGMVVISSIEAVYGIGHFMMNGFKLNESGSFDNPAGFASCICCSLPFAFYVRHLQLGRRVSNVAIAMMITAICISGSRVGVITAAMSIALSLKVSVRRTLWGEKWTFFATSTLLCGLLIALYYVKQHSADGRILIWCVVFLMMRDAPLWGHGQGAVEREYMEYQADFLQRFPNEHWQMLADNTKHLFNEYLEVLVQFGLIGLFLVITVLWLIFKTYKKCTLDITKNAFSSLLSILVFSCFSYPFTYPFTWLLLVLDVSIILYDAYAQQIVLLLLRHRKLLVCCMCLMTIIVGCQTAARCWAELEWNHAAKMQASCDTRLKRYEYLNSWMHGNPYFLYNYSVELYLAGRTKHALVIAGKCDMYWTDYDLELLKAVCHSELGEYTSSDAHLERAHRMCPNRFQPLYQQVLNLKEQQKTSDAKKLAREILHKKVKVLSPEVRQIRNEMRELLKER